MTASLFTMAILLSLAGGLVSIVFRAKKGNTIAQSFFALAGLLGCAAVTQFYLQDGVTVQVAATFPIQLTVNPLSAFFLGLVYLGMFLTAIYSIGSLPHYAKVYSLPWLNFASALFLVGMQATIMSSTVFSFLFMWETMSIAAYFLIIADRTDESMHAGFLYFIMTHLGFAALLAGFLLLSGGDPFLSWPLMARAASAASSKLLTVAFLLLFVGFGSKAGLVPLHQWLPAAHPQAPSGSSALLSGVMLKVALYGFLYSLSIFPDVPQAWGFVVLGVGLASAVFGVLHAAVESDMKRLLAWSSIENMGLIFSGIGAYMILLSMATTAGVALAAMVALFVAMHAINHFLFKSGLFMAAGVAVSEVHTRELDLLGGLARAWPFFSFLCLVLVLAAAALPPLGTFFGEWAFLQALAISIVALPLPYAAGAGGVLAVVALVSGLAIFTFAKFFSSVFLGRARSHHAENVAPISKWLLVPIALSALGSAVSSLVALPLLSSILVQGNGGFTAGVSLVSGASMNAWAIWGLAVIVFVVSYLLLKFVLRVSVRITDTWDCGQPLTPRMQYTSTGFAAPIRFFFRALMVTRKEMKSERISPMNPWIVRRSLEWSVDSVWERYMYRPLGNGIEILSHYIRKLQSGVIQMYLLFVVIALAITMYFAL